MSTYSLLYNDYIGTKNKINELLLCIADKDLKNRKFGIADNTTFYDKQFILYLSTFLNEQFCSIEVDDCFLNKVNSLYYKYK